MPKSVLSYGESGTYKSTAMRHLAHYVYKKTGKRTRVILTGASDGDMWKPEIQSGIAEVFRIPASDQPLPIIRKLAKGYWPRIEQTGSAYKLVMSPAAPTTWEKIGGYIWDSVSNTGDIIMRDTVDKARPMAQEVVTPFIEKVIVTNATGQVVEEQESFAAPARAHYNFIQNLTYGLIDALSSLPVEMVGFTCLEATSEEQDRTTILGPAIAGKKAITKVPSWVGDCIHHESYLVPRTIKVPSPADARIMIDQVVMENKVRCFFMRHPDPKFPSMFYPAKPRVPSEKFEELLKRYPGGYFEPKLEHGLDEFLEAEDAISDLAVDGMKLWREKIDTARGLVSASVPPASVAIAPVPTAVKS